MEGNITVNKKYHNKVAVAMYHLDPRWCSFEDFDKFSDLGIVNAHRCSLDGGCGTTTSLYMAQRAAEKGTQFWIGADAFFGRKQTLSEYMAQTDVFVKKLKDEGIWDAAVGFQWDEPLLKLDHSNKDFYDMTKALYEEYGKRIFPVFSLQELVGFKGNEEDNDGIRILHKEDTPFITDVGFDVYGYDFREPNERLAARLNQLGVQFGEEFKDGEALYRYYTKRMLDLMANDKANIWYFPCAYTCGNASGGVTDEDFCIAHMQGMKKLLLEHEHPGGLFMYTFKSWRNTHRALDYHLNENNPQRWDRFEACCKEIFNELSQIDLK